MSATLFAAHKNEVNNAIASLEAEILRLQQELANQQSYLQGVATCEPAGQSALDQAATFLQMVRAIAPTQEAVFWEAMEALKNPENCAAALEAAQAKREESQVIAPVPAVDTPEAHTEEAETTLDVDATEVIETEADGQTEAPETPKEDEADKPVLNGDGGDLLTVAQINALDWAVLKKIAGDRNITDPTGQRLTRKFVEGKLLGVLTWTEVKPLLKF